MGEGNVIVSAHNDCAVDGEVDKGAWAQLHPIHPDITGIGKNTNQVIDHSTQVVFGLRAGRIYDGDW